MPKNEKTQKRILKGPYERLAAIEVIDQMLREGVIFDSEENEALMNTRGIISRKLVEEKNLRGKTNCLSANNSLPKTCLNLS